VYLLQGPQGKGLGSFGSLNDFGFLGRRGALVVSACRSNSSVIETFDRSRNVFFQDHKMRQIAILSGNSHPYYLSYVMLNIVNSQHQFARSSKFRSQLAQSRNFQTARQMYPPHILLTPQIEIAESVRDIDVFIIQSGCGNVNDNLMGQFQTLIHNRTPYHDLRLQNLLRS
jgi:hypothetical protein